MHLFVPLFNLAMHQICDILLSGINPRKFKGQIGSLFRHCVNPMEPLPYCWSHIEVSYCTFGFGAIIQRDLGA